MPAKAVSKRCCTNQDCPLRGRFHEGNIVRHGFYRLKRGPRRRRYRCTDCGKTFSSTHGTPYHRLQGSRGTFDTVAAMSVEGVSKSSIARILHISWNTVARWLRRAAEAARRFNDRMTRGYELKEIQADEIRTFVDRRSWTTWVYAVIEVWSRLWPSCLLGKRSYRNTRRVIGDAIRRGQCEDPPLITTDGFQYYRPVIRRAFGLGCVYGQVMKRWRNNRVTRVERHLVIGSRDQLDDALWRSEDSSDLNTSFAERLNLTIRQGSAYLSRRTPCHARFREHLEDHLELLRCHYNFVRPHSALKFGTEVRTPAMQAGLVSRRLTFREVFMGVAGMFLCVVAKLDPRPCRARIKVAAVAA